MKKFNVNLIKDQIEHVFELKIFLHLVCKYICPKKWSQMAFMAALKCNRKDSFSVAVLKFNLYTLIQSHRLSKNFTGSYLWIRVLYLLSRRRGGPLREYCFDIVPPGTFPTYLLLSENNPLFCYGGLECIVPKF